MSSHKTLNAVALGVLLALANGCATSIKEIKASPEKEDVVRLQAMPTNEAIMEAETYITRSRESELDFLTPQHFDLATQAITEAKDMLAQNQPRQHVVQKVAVAEAMLKNGERVARQIKATLADELTIKSNLDELNAGEIYRGEYGSLIARLNNIIRQVEEGKRAEKEERESLLAEMSKLEKKSITYSALKEPKEILKRVKYRGGAELAPQTYNEALEVYRKAEEFINLNPHMRAAVEQLSDEALFAAKRALYIVEEVASLSHKISMSMEQVVLDEEYRLSRVAQALSTHDVRDNPLEVQSELLARYVEELSTQQKRQEDLVIALRDTLIKVRDSSTPEAVNASIRKLKKENGELVAKDALYSAKVSQLQAELEAKESQLALTNNRLERTEKALTMSEMESQALSMTVQQQKQQAAELNTPPQAETLTKESANEEDSNSLADADSGEVASQEVAFGDEVSAPTVENTVEETNEAPQAIVENEVDDESKTTEPNNQTSPLAPEPVASAPIIDKPVSAIIAELNAEEPTAVQADPVKTSTEQAAKPEALAAGN